MALQIKDTPVLRGRNAENFYKEIERSEHEKVSSAELERMRSNYELIMKNAKFE